MEILMYVLIFGIVYLVYYFFVISKNEKLKKFEKSTEIRYLKNVYKINIDKIDKKKLGHILGLTNSFIITLTVFIISFVESLLFQLLIGFLVLIILEVIVYHIVGKTMQKRGNKNV